MTQFSFLQSHSTGGTHCLVLSLGYVLGCAVGIQAAEAVK